MIVLLLALACTPSPDDRPTDADGDGYPAGEDCDDSHPRVHPGAEETWYDGLDQDCDGRSDFDRDGDGDDAPSGGGTDCDDGDPRVHGLDGDADGVSLCDADCDDADPAVHPLHVPVCGDGLDNDCDGVQDCRWSGEHRIDDVATHRIDVLGHGIGGQFDVGDVDGDGLDDVFGVSPVLVDGWLWRAPLPVAGSVADAERLPGPATEVAAIDVNDDGALDLWLDRVGGSVWFPGPVHDLSDPIPVAIGGAHSVRAGDVTGDGVTDLIRVAYVLSVRPGPVFDSGDELLVLGEGGLDYILDPVAVADFDGDGLDDVVLMLQGAGWLVSGPVPIGETGTPDELGRQVTPRTSAGMLEVLDADGDGTDDLLAGTSIWLGPLQTEGIGLPAIDLPDVWGWATRWAQAIGDMDADGWDDVAVVVLPSHTHPDLRVVVMHGPLTGDPLRQTTFVVSDVDRTRGLASGDVDGDGTDDLVLHLERNGVDPNAELVVIPGRTGW